MQNAYNLLYHVHIKEKQNQRDISHDMCPIEYFSADAQLRTLQRKQTSQVRYWADLKHKQDFRGTDLIFTSNNLSPSAQPMGPAHGPSPWVQPTGPPQESVPAFPVCQFRLP